MQSFKAVDAHTSKSDFLYHSDPLALSKPIALCLQRFVKTVIQKQSQIRRLGEYQLIVWLYMISDISH